MEELIKTSPSKINLFNECPRCFFLQENRGIKRPRGIMSSLPGAIDILVKARMDQARATGTIKEIEGISDRYKLYSDQAKLRKWRYWKTGLSYTSNKGLTLAGAMDDLLVTLGGTKYAPFDIKTKGKEPTQEDSEKYYQSQMDAYSLLLAKNGMKVSGEAILLYYYPVSVDDETIRFTTKINILKVDPNRAAKKCLEIIELLSTDKIPEPNPACDYCNMLEQSRGI